MPVIVYGLKNCDTCKRALKDLVAAHVVHRFVDIRAETDLARAVPAWIEAAGAEALTNTRSTTWRNLDDEEKRIARDDPAGLMIAHPTLIKPPVCETPQGVFVGWSPEARRSVLASAD